MLSVRLLVLDHYISKPVIGIESNYDDNRRSSSVPAPVLRIYGPTSTGEKACVHVHGVFPYLYVPYEGGENPDRDALLLAAGLDKTLQATGNEKYKSMQQRHVHRVRLVSGIPMYGYHSKHRQFFKVYFYNPYSVRRAADLLLAGAILNMKLQPHESHIPFTQQFMIDFNLFGMSLVNFSKVMYRRDPDTPNSLLGIDPNLILPSGVNKTSHCAIEVDVLAEDILNRLEEREASANPGLAGIWAEERARRRLKGRSSEPTQPSSQSRPSFDPFGVEFEFLKDLQTRIQKILPQEETVLTDSTEVKTPYPAEVPEDSNIMEASILDSGDTHEDPLPEENELLINESLIHELTQKFENLGEEESQDEHVDSEGDDTEGRGDGVEPEERGVDLDMTQPLSPPGGWSASAVPEREGEGSSESEEEFWKEMAEQIDQMDGAGDSDSDPQNSLTNWSNWSFLGDEDCLNLQPLSTPQSFWDWSSWSPSQSGVPCTDSILQFPLEQFPDTPVSVVSSVSSNPIDIEDLVLPESRTSSSELWTNLINMIASRTDDSDSLTLKDYLKGEITSVNFKIVNNIEMVVIEYKPRDQPDLGKVLIKPLYEFIQEWNNAEINRDCNPKYVNGFTSPTAQQPTNHTDHFDKECQTVDTERLAELAQNQTFDETYRINKNVITKKRICMKLISTQTCNKPENLIPKKEPESIDKEELIKNVNNKFEEYYQRLIGKTKRKTVAEIKTEHEVIDLSDSNSSSDCDYPKPTRKSKAKRQISRKRHSKRQPVINPAEFVSQILSSYSNLPQTGSLPPMSITVNIGDPTVPVQVNVQPQRSSVFDGPDDSSSDESVEKIPKRKKPKFKPLQVVVQPSPARSRKSDSPYCSPRTKPESSKRHAESPSCSPSLERGPVEASTPVSTKNTAKKLTCKAKRVLTIRPELFKNEERMLQIPQTDVYASSSEENEKNPDDGLKSSDVPLLSNESALELFPEEFNEDEKSFVFGNVVPKSRTFTPAFLPPSKFDVTNSLSECEQLEPTGPVPHYSNIKDVSKRIEIGTKVLKVEHQYAGLKIHKSWMNLFGIEERRKIRLGGCDYPRSSLVANGMIVLKPLLRPPTRNEVREWIMTKSEKPVIEKTPKLKMLVRGGDGDSDEASGDESMTLTPCTPSVLSDTSLHSPTAEEKNDDSLLPLKSRRRVSFESTSQDSQKQFGNRTLPMIEEDILERFKKDPFNTKKGLKRLKEARRISTDSNKSNDVFDSGDNKGQKGKTFLASDISSDKDQSCEIRGISLNNTFGFKTSLQNFQNVRPSHDFQYTTLLVVEVLTETRGDLRPDPESDSILAIFHGIVRDYPPNGGTIPDFGVFTVGDVLKGSGFHLAIESFPDEKTLLDHLVAQIRLWDPDMLCGYEIEQGSWGYILQRGCVLGMNIASQLGRTIVKEKEPQVADPLEDYDDVPRFIRQLKVPGRIILNVWRLLRHEMALTSYTFENIMFHLLHERHSVLSYSLLSHLWQHQTPRARYIPAKYHLTRIRGVCRILVQLDLISRTSELARLFGIQFEEVLTRGSQFRVESMMLRLAKPANFVPVSPSMQQRAHMRAPGTLPLIMEPESKFYSDPVIVLDFQSLYPSMIIAYNYCFSTCLGRVTLLGNGDVPYEFGCTRLSVPSSDLISLANGNMNVSPAGIAFVKENVRRGILPSMLEEILDTRLMVKKSMKENKEDKLLQKVLHARQLGLKLIANVTYGYTAANFSGRMPCIEVGDSVVSKGRETLQRAIRLVQSTPRWGARVVYGDTDSLFVMTPGRTRQEAFRIGAEIAAAVTQDNPRPVKLKLEKVYQPCILQTKKRYVGYMYESENQTEPVYEAKGIETVRRDGCPATAKILQKSLQILFETGDVSQVKKYTLQQFTKLFQGRCNIQDLIYAKEYRGRNGYRPGACVPALQLARQWTVVDKRAEPRRKERVPYVIVHGAPGVPLIRLVRSPRELLADPNLQIHAAYYITKAIIPPMKRCFTLLGADPLTWYAEMPRRYHRMVRSGIGELKKRITISQYFASLECVACGRMSQERVCPDCLDQPARLATILTTRERTLDRANAAAVKVCQNCCGRLDYIDCISLDCPVLYRRKQIQRDAEQSTALREIHRTVFQS